MAQLIQLHKGKAVIVLYELTCYYSIYGSDL